MDLPLAPEVGRISQLAARAGAARRVETGRRESSERGRENQRGLSKRWVQNEDNGEGQPHLRLRTEECLESSWRLCRTRRAVDDLHWRLYDRAVRQHRPDALTTRTHGIHDERDCVRFRSNKSNHNAASLRSHLHGHSTEADKE